MLGSRLPIRLSWKCNAIHLVRNKSSGGRSLGLGWLELGNAVLRTGFQPSAKLAQQSERAGRLHAWLLRFVHTNVSYWSWLLLKWFEVRRMRLVCACAVSRILSLLRRQTGNIRLALLAQVSIFVDNRVHLAHMLNRYQNHGKNSFR